MKYAMVVLCIVIIVLAYMFIRNRTVPASVALVNGSLAPLPSSPNAVSSQTDDASRRVEPLSFKTDIEESKNAIRKALQELGDIKVVAERDNYLHAVATASTMGFNDDLVFLFDDKARVVHFRSQSRVGWSDMGVNGKRYEQLRKLYEAQ